MEKIHYDYLIVGTGLFGATFNAIAKRNGHSCLLIDSRDHIGGNIYTPIVDGIPIHQYGAHIFHTDDKGIWDFVCENCDMVPFVNSPIANYKGEIYNLPFNMNTFSKMFGVSTPEEAKACIEKEITEANITYPKNLEEQAISLVGKTIYTKLIKEYTEKQWGRDCSELDPSIIKRLPVRFTYDNNYFNDKYQGIPAGGYNTLIENLIGTSPVLLNTNYLEKKEFLNSAYDFDHIIYTGPIDEYFGFKFGHLDWRTVSFKTSKVDVQNLQGVPVMNFTSHNEPFTRRIEHKFFDKSCEGFNKDYTYVSEEYSTEWTEGMDPYYPVNNKKNAELYNRYAEYARETEPNVTFAGRLGKYKYYDMDDTIAAAMSAASNVQ